MAIDAIWETTFRKRDWGRYPNEELVRFVARNFRNASTRSSVAILEVGCGSANNVWFLAREGFNVVGIDGATSAIERGCNRLKEENVSADLRVLDALSIEANFSPETFDAVVDVGCIQCNRIEDAREILRQMAAVTRPGGSMFSLLVADDSIGMGRGDMVEPGTFENITVGPLQGTGLNHFYSLEEVKVVFEPFAPLSVEYVERSYSGRTQRYRTWVVIGQKPK